nr:hypothetical protein BaRGS_010520 [Batillaria attramentaria]
MRAIILLLLVAVVTAQTATKELSKKELVEQELAVLSQAPELRGVNSRSLAQQLCKILNSSSKTACTVVCRQYLRNRRMA